MAHEYAQLDIEIIGDVLLPRLGRSSLLRAHGSNLPRIASAVALENVMLVKRRRANAKPTVQAVICISSQGREMRRSTAEVDEFVFQCWHQNRPRNFQSG